MLHQMPLAEHQILSTARPHQPEDLLPSNSSIHLRVKATLPSSNSIHLKVRATRPRAKVIPRKATRNKIHTAKGHPP